MPTHKQTKEQLEKIADRMLVLIEQSPNPFATMQMVARKLEADGLGDVTPTSKMSSMQFVEAVIVDNPAMYDRVRELRVTIRAERAESAEELIDLLLLPVESA